MLDATAALPCLRRRATSGSRLRGTLHYTKCPSTLARRVERVEADYEDGYFTVDNHAAGCRELHFGEGGGLRHGAASSSELARLGKASGRLCDLGAATGHLFGRSPMPAGMLAASNRHMKARAIAGAESIPVYASYDEASAGGGFSPITLHHVLEHARRPRCAGRGPSWRRLEHALY